MVVNSRECRRRKLLKFQLEMVTQWRETYLLTVTVRLLRCLQVVNVLWSKVCNEEGVIENEGNALATREGSKTIETNSGSAQQENEARERILIRKTWKGLPYTEWTKGNFANHL